VFHVGPAYPPVNVMFNKLPWHHQKDLSHHKEGLGLNTSVIINVCLVVTLCTIGFLHSAYSVHRCVLRGSEMKTMIISLHNIDGLVHITETECVYCAVRSGSLNMIHSILIAKGSAASLS